MVSLKWLRSCPPLDDFCCFPDVRIILIGKGKGPVYEQQLTRLALEDPGRISHSFCCLDVFIYVFVLVGGSVTTASG